MSEESLPPFRGIIPPVVTPLSDAEELDEAGLERLVDHLIEGGVHGLFMLGSNGEGPSLDEKVQRRLVERTCRQTAGRLPVLMGISHTSLSKSVAASHIAADAGCTAVVATPPYYMPLDQDELLSYFRQLARRVPLPLVLYNFPILAKVAFDPATFKLLLDEPNIVGIKDSSGNLDYFTEIVRVANQRPGFSLLAGTEAQLSQVIKLGGHGGVAGGANVWPQMMVGLYEAIWAEDHAGVSYWNGKVAEFGEIYRVAGDRFSAVIAGLKTALAIRGICSGVLASPILPVTAAQKAQVKALLAALELA